MDREKVLFAMLRAVICGKPLPDEVKTACTAESPDAVYTLAYRPDFACWVG